MSTSEFSQRPFAVGSLIGVRSFRVAPSGVLTGVVRPEPWTAGVNEAICSKPVDTFANAMRGMAVSGAALAWALTDMSAAMRGKVNLRKRPPRHSPPPATEPAPHQAGTLDCTCGFYAYFDEGHNPHHAFGNVLGIVEGFGVCTTGTRGFRSSKARLRALIFDPFLPPEHDAIRVNYPDVAVFRSLGAALAEFPLTPVEGVRKPEPVSIFHAGGFVTYTVSVDTRRFDEAMRSMYRAFSPKPVSPKSVTDETPQERALRLRRERNTGPDGHRGIDGHYRRGRTR